MHAARVAGDARKTGRCDARVTLEMLGECPGEVGRVHRQDAIAIAANRRQTNTEAEHYTDSSGKSGLGLRFRICC